MTIFFQKLSLVVTALFCIASHTFCQNTLPVSTADELQSFYNIASLPAYRSHTVSGQVSTYDTTGGNNDGFGGEYSFIRRNKDSSLVLFDMKGPGVINRIWTPTPTNDTFDFYGDDTVHPALTISYRDLFSGKVFPFLSPLCGNQLGGYFCYYPILFQKRCRIVSRGKRMQFHQIQYRLFCAGTKVASFSIKPDEGIKAALEKIKALWNNPAGKAADFLTNNQSVKTIDTTIVLQPGDIKTIADISNGGRIACIELYPSSAFEGLYKNIDIRISWDDETIPAVDCPVADFFGYAFGKTSMQSLLLGTANGKSYCYLPMPFSKKAKVELVYRKAEGIDLPAIHINSSVTYTAQPQDAATEGKLYAYWQQTKPATGEPFVFLNVQGMGHYVATLLQAQGLQTGMTIFFEGDDSTLIDGTLRLHGTGSEDYFNGGWYALKDRWDAPMSLPTHGALDYSLLFGRTGAYRLYLNDKLSFDKSFYHTIEHGPEHNQIPVLYTSVCFYYSNTPPNKLMLPEDVDTKVYIPDTLNIYPEFTKLSVGDNMMMETSGDSATVEQSIKMKVANESSLILYPENIPAGTYTIYADVVNQPEGCKYSIWQRQTQLSEWMDTKANINQLIKNKLLGKITITELNKTMTIRFTTDDTHHRFFLSKLMLVKTQ